MRLKFKCDRFLLYFYFRPCKWRWSAANRAVGAFARFYNVNNEHRIFEHIIHSNALLRRDNNKHLLLTSSVTYDASWEVYAQFPSELCGELRDKSSWNVMHLVYCKNWWSCTPLIGYEMCMEFTNGAQCSTTLIAWGRTQRMHTHLIPCTLYLRQPMIHFVRGSTLHCFALAFIDGNLFNSFCRFIGESFSLILMSFLECSSFRFVITTGNKDNKPIEYSETVVVPADIDGKSTERNDEQ